MRVPTAGILIAFAAVVSLCFAPNVVNAIEAPAVPTKQQGGADAKTATADNATADTAADSAAASARWNLKQGQRFEVAYWSVAEISTRVDTRLNQTALKTVLEFEWDVVEVRSESFVVRQILKRVQLESGSPGDVSGNNLSFDSAEKIYRKGISGKIAKEYQSLIGLVAQFELSVDGQWSALKLDAGQEEKLRKLPQDSSVRAFFMSGLAESLSEVTGLSNLRRASNNASGQNRDNVVVEFDAERGFLVKSSVAQTLSSTAPYRDLQVKTSTELVKTFLMKEVE